MIIKNLGKVVGRSAYEVWLDQGNVGTEEDFLNSFVPVKGEDYYTEADKEEMVNLVLDALPVAEESEF